MAKIQSIKPVGKRLISKVEVESDNSENSNLYKDSSGTIHHNCNGPHVPLVVVDEIDTVSGEGLKAFKEISGMLDSQGNKQALRVGISTRKTRYGLMNQQIENAEKQGRHLRKWTAFEFCKACPESLSGKLPTDYWVCQDNMEVIDEEFYKRIGDNKKKDYTLYNFPGEKCGKCPIAAICLGDAKKQTSNSTMLKPLDDIIKKVLSEGADWALAQLMNLKPSVEGIVFKEYDPKVHLKNWNELWQILVGKPFPGECNQDIFVAKCFSSDTEVMTNNGFKLFKDLTPYDTVASMNDDGKLIYETPINYIAKHHKGEMVNIYNKIGGHGKQLDLLVTPDHQQTYIDSDLRRKGTINIRKTNVEDLPCGDFYIPAAAFSLDDKPDIDSPISYMTGDQFFAFLGLWLSEGYSSRKKSNYRISVSQSKSIENVNKVHELMNSIKWPKKLHFRRDKRQKHGGSWSTHSKELHSYLDLAKLAPNKYIYRSIMENASNRQLKILLDWLMFGDGTEYLNDPDQQPSYGTGSIRLADDVQELAFRLGYRTTYTAYDYRKKTYRDNGTEHLVSRRVHIHMKDTGKGKHSNLTKKTWYIANKGKHGFSENEVKNIETVQNYDDMVYCLTMPSGRLFVRRNGIISLSGNCHEMKLPFYSGVDWGWSNPNTVVYACVDKKDNVYIVKTDGMKFISQPAWIHYLLTKYQSYFRCQLYFPDVADQGAVAEMKLAGLPVSPDVDKSINTGIQCIKKFLKVPGQTEPKIFLAKETTTHLQEEFNLYHYKTDSSGLVSDVPEDDCNHWIDALRYIMSMLFGKQTMMMATMPDESIGSPIDRNGNFNRTPTPSEFANSRNIQFDEHIDTSKIGKVGTLGQLDQIDEDESNGSSGNFLWEF